MATDPLDVLFLSRFLRATCPDVQLFVLESDELFVRAAHDYQLEGLLTISNYPLFLQNQEYGAQRPPRRIPFASAYAEGTYNACRRVLLKWQNYPQPNSCPLCSAGNCPSFRDLMLEYSSPFKVCPTRTKPALWLSVIGHDNFWPVSLLDDGTGTSPFPGTEKKNLMKSSLVQGADLADTTGEFVPEPRSLIWQSLVIGLGLFSLLNLLCILLMNLPGPKERAKALRRYDAIRSFSLRQEGDYAAPRAAHILVMLIAVVLMDALLLYPSAVLQWRWEIVLFSGTIVLLLVTAIWMTIVSLRERKGRIGSPILTAMAWLIGGAAAILLACLALREQVVSHVNQFFAYRSIHPESGVSPIAPLLILAIAIYYWGWIQIRRLRFAEERRPEIPEDSVVASPIKDIST